MEGLSRPPLRSSPLPRRSNGPRWSRAAFSGSTVEFTSAARILDRSPSLFSGKLRIKRSLMARSRTASPRNSSTSLCPALFSRSQDTWVKARASKEASENEYPNSFSSRACCEFFFRLACVRCERVMALDTGRDSLQWSPPQPSRFKIVDFDFDFTINLISSRKDQDREIVSAESSTQASGSIDLLFNKHG